MSEEKKIITFEDLYKRDINDYVEKLEKKYKDKKTGEWKSFYLSYLSWAYGHREMKRIDPDATEHVHTFPLVTNGQVIEGIEVPYLQTPQGFFVQSTVTINGRSETEWLPVLDNSNNPVDNPNSFQINTSNKRCFVKALAKHGLGLYLYVGEDLPENISDNQEEPKPIQQQTSQNNQPPSRAELDKELEQTIQLHQNFLLDRGLNLGAMNKWIIDQEGVNNITQVERIKVMAYLKQQVQKIKTKEAKEEAEQAQLFEGQTTTISPDLRNALADTHNKHHPNEPTINWGN